jgi:hypothetical protein
VFASGGEASRRAPRVTAVVLCLTASLLPDCHRSSMPPRPDGAAVVVSPEVLDDGLQAVAETEPNDTLSTAQRLMLSMAAPAAVAGSLAKAAGAKRDVDLFRVDLPATDAGAPNADGAVAPPPRSLLRADLKPEAGWAATLDALDAAGHLLVSATGQPGEAIAIPNLAVTAGLTYLRVRSVGAEPPPGGYRLVARLAPFDLGAEVEPNGTAALATELSPGAEAVGYLGWRHDQDWYRLPTAGLAEGSVLSVDLDPVPGVAASLQLCGADARKLTEAHGRKGERVVLRDVRFPPGDAQVFLVVRADADWSADARYNVRPRADLPKPGSEAEPNDDPDHAQTVADGTVVGYLGRGDVDVYRYATDAPAALEVEVSAPERTSVRVEILRADGTLLSRTEGGRHGPIRIANLAIPGGPIFIRLAGSHGAANPDDPYHLTISSRASDANQGAPGEPPPAKVP